MQFSSYRWTQAFTSTASQSQKAASAASAPRLRNELRNGVFGSSKKSFAALAYLLAAIGGSATLAATIDNNASFQANVLAPNDDGSTGAVPLGFTANFFGTNYSTAFVNNNGNMTFDSALGTYTPFGLTGGGIPPIIAPFFADVDTSSAGSPVTYGTGTVGGRNAFGVDYVNVDYFSSSPSHTNRNSFQVILVDRSDTGAGNFDIYFNYNQIQWEAGTASGGDANGRGGTCAAAGYSNGSGTTGTNAQIDGSLTCGAFLDGGPNAMVSSTNDGVPGQFLFRVRGGVVVTSVTDPVVATYGIVRQLNAVVGRHQQQIVGLRMDGLTGGGEDIASADAIIKEAAGMFGDQNIRVFGALDVGTGSFVPIDGIRNNFNLTHLDMGIDDTFSALGGGIGNARFGFVAGIAFADSSPTATTLPISNAEVDSRGIYNLSLYGGLDFLDYGYADITGTYSGLDYRMNRHFGPDRYSGNVDTRQFNLSIRAGYDFPIMGPISASMPPSMTISAGPYGILDYTDGRIDAFRESSATDPLNGLHYPSVNYDAWTTQVGGRVNVKNVTSTGYTYGVTFNAAWQHQFADLPPTVVVPTIGTFLTSLAPFGVHDDSAARIGVRAWTAGFAKNVTVALDYNGLFGNNIRDNSFMVQARYSFE